MATMSRDADFVRVFATTEYKLRRDAKFLLDREGIDYVMNEKLLAGLHVEVRSEFCVRSDDAERARTLLQQLAS